MNTTNLHQIAYFKLLDDLINIVLPNASVNRENLENKHVDLLAERIQELLSWKKVVHRRTMREYLKVYNPKSYYKNQLSAVWLHYREKYELTSIREHFKDNPNSGTRYWERYLKLFTLKIMQSRETSDKLGKEVTDPFFLHVFDNIYRRRSYIQEIISASLTNKILIIEGQASTGKTFIASDFATDRLQANQYRRVLWKTCSNNYTLNSFLKEFEQQIQPLASPTHYRKALDALSYITSERWLLVLDSYEKANHATFAEFLETAATNFGGTNILITINNNEKLSLSGREHHVEIHGFDRNELIDFLKFRSFPYIPALVDDLLLTTDGSPYLVGQFLNKFGNDIAFDQLDKNKLLTASSTEWFNEILNRLTEDERQLLNVLAIYDLPFNYTTADFFAKKLKLQSGEQAVRKLYCEDVAHTIGASLFDIDKLFKHYIILNMEKTDTNLYHVFSADQLLAGYGSRVDKNASYAEVRTIYEAILHMQLAGKFKRSNDLIKNAIPHFKRLAMYDELNEVIQNQWTLQKSYPMPFYDRWFNWHLSHTAFITGNFESGYQHISECLDEALAMSDYELRKDETVAFFLKSFQLYAEYIEILANWRRSQSLLESALALFDPINLEWNLRIGAISLLSSYYFSSGEYEKVLEINKNILQDSLILTKQAIGVAHTRMAIMLYHQRTFDQAIEHLTKASSLFGDFGDRRGLAWSNRYLSECLLENDQLKDGKLIAVVIEISKEANLYDKDYSRWLEHFGNSVLSAELYAQIVGEKVRLANLETNIIRLTENIHIEDHITNYLDKLKTKSQGIFSYKKYVRPFENNAIKVNSLSVKSFSVKVQKVAIAYLEDLFTRKSIENIFAYHLNNAIIKDCAGLSGIGKTVADRFIIPNLPYLKTNKADNRDSIKYVYARALQSAGATTEAFEMLACIDVKNYRSDFYNVKGNCYRNNYEFDQAYDNYNKALGFERLSRRDKGRIYNNLAKLILHCKKEQHYLDGIKYCLAALNERKDEPFIRYPIKYQFIFQTELTNKDQLESVLSTTIKKYRIGKKELRSIIIDIPNIKKREFIEEKFIAR